MIVFGGACFEQGEKSGSFGRCFMRRVAELSPMRQMFSETDFGFKAGESTVRQWFFSHFPRNVFRKISDTSEKWAATCRMFLSNALDILWNVFQMQSEENHCSAMDLQTFPVKLT